MRRNLLHMQLNVGKSIVQGRGILNLNISFSKELTLKNIHKNPFKDRVFYMLG